MATIFKNAAKIAVWLGEEEETDKEAFEMIEPFDDAAGSGGFQEFINSDVLRTTASKPSPDDMTPSSFLNTEEGWTYNIGLSSLLARPWFTRSWVVQEVALASKAQVVSGTRSCSWSALSRLALYLHYNPVVGFRLLIRPMTVMSLLRRLEPEQELEQNLSVMDVLDLTRVFQCTDPHDKVFAFLGFFSTHIDTGIVVDYELPCEELFMSVAQQTLLWPELVFYLLSLAGYTREASNRNLPSWVPDWSAKLERSSPSNVIQQWRYKAASDSNTEISLGSSPLTILISGYFFD